jgi:pimeloyl-ACP methyl ester carboxylesterase
MGPILAAGLLTTAGAGPTAYGEAGAGHSAAAHHARYPRVVSDAELYRPPKPLPPGRAGDVIQLTAPIRLAGGGTEQKILYRSTTDSGRPTAVSAKIFIPDHVTAHAPVISLAHGTIGLADCAAPSKDDTSHEAELAFFAGLAQEGLPAGLFNQGAIVVATDYEGLGTPGVHPYVIGRSEAADVLDAIRAARRLTRTTGKSMVIGHSQGGGAALWAAQLAPHYAPDAHVAGAVAGAPAVELTRMVPLIEHSDFFGYVFMVAAGFHAAHPELDLSRYFTAAGLAVTHKLATTCDQSVFGSVAGHPVADYVKSDPTTPGSTFARLLRQNTPGNQPTSVPIFIYHGDADEQLPVESSQWYVDRTCRTGGYTVERKTYPGADHHSVIVAAKADVLTFIADRLAGRTPNRQDCA